MGWEQVTNTSQYNVRNFGAGWFPGRNYNDIPGSLDNSEPIGSPDCNFTIWYDGALRKIFGYTAVTASPLNSGALVTSIFYSTVLDDWVATAGNKVYGNADNSAPTDITGAVVVTAGYPMKWTDYIFSTTLKLAIGANGVDTPIKWTGSGNAGTLGGSPPAGRWVTTWQNSLWLANTSSAQSTLYFSNLGDPETWTAGDNYNFDSPITGLEPLGDKLVVFMADHIGVLQGSNNRLLTKIERYITNIGCSGGQTVSPAKVDGRDVLIFHSGDGFYIFDGSTKVTKVSSCIQNKYTGGSSVEKFNVQRFTDACGVYVPRFEWYFTAMSSGADTTNLFGMVLDLKRPMTTPNGVIVPHWPMEDVADDISCIAASPTVDIDSSILFGSSDGNIYKFVSSTYNHNGTAYTGQWKSKVFDMGAQSIVQEVNVLGESQSSTSALTVYVDGDIGTDDGISGSTDFSTVSDTLDVDFILGSSSLASAGSAYKNIETGNFGRFLSFKVENTQLDEEMVVNMLNCVVTNISVDSNAGN